MMRHIPRATAIGLATAALAVVATLQPSPASATTTPGIDGVEAGSGTLVVAGTSTPFVPRGFNSIGLLYPEPYASTLCNGMNQGTKTELAAAWTNLTTHPDKVLLGMKTHWRANAVRFQVSQGALSLEHTAGGSTPYTDTVLSVIQQARAMGLVVFVSVQTEYYSCTPKKNGALVKLPDQDTANAWSQLTPTLGQDRGVLLEIFNEPKTQAACGTTTQYDWAKWAHGCSESIGGTDGMVNVANTVRTSAPDNVLVLDGDNNAGKLTNFDPPADTPTNTAYAVHPYYYADGTNGWNQRFGALEASGAAITATEWNESASCQHETLGNQLIDTYLPDHNIGLMVHSWDAPGARLVSGDDDPVDSIPNCTSFTGATPAFDEFWSQAGGLPEPEVHVAHLTMSAGKVNDITLALASNGSHDMSTGPQVASSVNVRLRKQGSATTAWIGSMTLDTSSPWTDGSYTVATATGLSSKSHVANPGDTLIFRVRYAGESTYHDTTYLVP